MDPFKQFNGIVAPVDQANINTDQIVPKQYLKLVGRIGFGQYLFHDARFDKSGNPNPKFVLNDPRYKEAKILLARSNFGCGSSREHAVWAISDYGFKTVIASSYADIFYNNCFKNGLLPITLDEKIVDSLFREATTPKPCSLNVNLAEQTIHKINGEVIEFQIDAYKKKCLLEGLDDIGLTLKYEDKIRDHERALSRYVLVNR